MDKYIEKLEYKNDQKNYQLNSMKTHPKQK